MNPANEHIARVLTDTNEVWPTEVVFQERKAASGEAEKQAMPEPAFRLTWSDDRARYSVSKPRIGDTDVYTADQVCLLVEEAVKFKALYEKSQELFARERAITKELAEALRDMNAGWKYIRGSHGDLCGVGWDRAQDKADAALSKVQK